MTLFTYNADQRASILSSLPGSVYFGTEEASDDEVVAVLTARASEYLTRKRMLTADGVRKKLDALEVVKSMLSDPSDDGHRGRILKEIDRWSLELALIDCRERDHRARLRFMVDAFEVFADAEGTFSPIASTVSLSDSNSPARRFFDAAISPVCEAAGEPLGIRAAIASFNIFKEETTQGEYLDILGEVAYAAKARKT